MKSAPDAVGINTALIDHARFGPRLTKVVTAYAICSTIYKSGEQWRQKLKTKQQYQVTVNGTDATYDDLHEWILAQLPENKRRALIARTGAMVERITDNGFLLQIYGTVLTMTGGPITGGPNHFGIITIAQHVILNGTPDRIITYEISNQGEK